MSKSRKLPKVRLPKLPRLDRLAAKRRAELVARVAEVLAERSDPTPFRHEGDAIHGIRGGLLLSGACARWRAADLIARDIMAAALNKLGAERPTWEQGQREYVDATSDRCMRCKRWIDRTDASEYAGRRFCSKVVSMAWHALKAYYDAREAKMTAMRLRRIASKAAAPIERCASCGAPVQRSAEARQRGGRPVCSARCRGRLNRGSAFGDLPKRRKGG